MKIISEHSDYYDITLAKGHDDHVTYVRKEEEIEGKEFDFPQGMMERTRGTKPSVYAHFIALGFCGKIYPIVMLRLSQYSKDLEKYISIEKYAHNIEDLYRVAEEMGIEIDHKKKKKIASKWAKYGFRIQDRAEAFFEMSFKEFEKYFQEYKTPLFVVRSGYTNRYDYEFFINPVLKEYAFQTVIDPHTAFQDIEMYIGGVLGSAGRKVPEVADEDRFSGRGFDKHSFRMPKGRKKPRRKGK